MGRKFDLCVLLTISLLSNSEVVHRVASMSTALGVGLAVGLTLFFIVFFGGLLMILRSVALKKEADAWRRYPQARRVDRAASFFGQQSRGPGQIRGNGTLILTESELIFEMWLPRREFRIPLASIESLENPKSFLGKSRFTPLLKVVFNDQQGSKDSMAWQVRDLSGWMEQIDKARRES